MQQGRSPDRSTRTPGRPADSRPTRDPTQPSARVRSRRRSSRRWRLPRRAAAGGARSKTPSARHRRGRYRGGSEEPLVLATLAVEALVPVQRRDPRCNVEHEERGHGDVDARDRPSSRRTLRREEYPTRNEHQAQRQHDPEHHQLGGRKDASSLVENTHGTTTQVTSSRSASAPDQNGSRDSTHPYRRLASG